MVARMDDMKAEMRAAMKAATMVASKDFEMDDLSVGLMVPLSVG